MFDMPAPTALSVMVVKVATVTTSRLFAYIIFPYSGLVKRMLFLQYSSSCVIPKDIGVVWSTVVLGGAGPQTHQSCPTLSGMEK